MTWKPTDEMVELAAAKFLTPIPVVGEELSHVAFCREILIAVQPLIAAQERERYKNECAKFGYSCAHVSALLEEKRVMWTADIAALVERAMAEARAKAIEEAAVIAEGYFVPGHSVAGPHFAAACASHIRSLIPKPVEGT